VEGAERQPDVSGNIAEVYNRDDIDELEEQKQ
jgi:hypothetical protein